jgi:hypothetical protein
MAGSPNSGLIRLPRSFVELYSLVNRVKGRDNTAALDESDDIGSSETAICLLTGTMMKSGSPRRAFSRPVSLKRTKTIYMVLKRCIVQILKSFLSTRVLSLHCFHRLVPQVLVRFTHEGLAPELVFSFWSKNALCL